MNTILQFLQGKKTYIVAILAGVYAALVGAGVAPNAEFIWALLGSSALAALRAGIAKAEGAQS